VRSEDLESPTNLREEPQVSPCMPTLTDLCVCRGQGRMLKMQVAGRRCGSEHSQGTRHLVRCQVSNHAQSQLT
jgi:hypothetical protein